MIRQSPSSGWLLSRSGMTRSIATASAQVGESFGLGLLAYRDAPLGTQRRQYSSVASHFTSRLMGPRCRAGSGHRAAVTAMLALALKPQMLMLSRNTAACDVEGDTGAVGQHLAQGWAFCLDLHGTTWRRSPECPAAARRTVH